MALMQRLLTIDAEIKRHGHRIDVWPWDCYTDIFALGEKNQCWRPRFSAFLKSKDQRHEDDWANVYEGDDE